MIVNRPKKLFLRRWGRATGLPVSAAAVIAADLNALVSFFAKEIWESFKRLKRSGLTFKSLLQDY